MKKNLFQSAAVAFSLFLLVNVFADLNGKWVGNIQIPGGGELPVTFTFKVEGGKLTGSAEAEGSGALPIENGKLSGDNFSFTINAGGADILHSGVVYTDSLVLSIDFGGEKNTSTFKRAK